MFSFFRMWLLRRQSLRLLKAFYSIRHKNPMYSKPRIFLKNPEIASLRLRNLNECVSYLMSKGLIGESYTKEGILSYYLTDAGNNYFPDVADGKVNTLVHSIILPVVVAVLTTLLTMWINGFFDVRSKAIQLIPTPTAINSPCPQTTSQPSP